MKYRRIKQENIKDCGAACLLSIIRYYKGDNTLENIRFLTKCDTNGISAYNLIEASKKLGFDSYGIKCNIDYLIKIKLPCIAHIVINKTYMHYIVIEKVNILNNKIEVYDPVKGKGKYSFDEFNEIWTNVLIILDPIRKLDVIKQSNQIKLYIDLIKPFIKHYILIILISFISIFFTILSSFYLKILIDKNNLLINIYIVFLIIIILKCLLDFIRNKITILVDSSIDKKLTIKFYEKLISLPHYYFNSRQSGEIINKMNELVYVEDLIVKIPIILFINISIVLFSCIVLVNINLILFLVFLIFIIIYFLVYLLFNKKNKRYIRENQENKSIIDSYTNETIDGIYTIKNMNITNHTNNIFRLKYSNVISGKYMSDNHYNKENLIKDLVLFIGINTVLFVGFILINNKVILLSDLILFNSLIFYFLDPLKSIFDLEPNINDGITYMKRINDIFGMNHELIGTYNSNNVTSIKITNLHFSYNNNIIFNNESLNINNKDKILITGRSGLGKSTLFKIITKQYDVNDNMVFINNIDINTWDQQSLLNNICYVSERDKIFNDTIKNNIVIDNNISKKYIKKIIKLTYLKSVMSDKKISLNSFVFENGSNFSLGEKQRIVLARVLLKNNNVLILDESLSGLDFELEKKIIKNILKLYKNKIFIYISHRTINEKYFDRVINFSNKERRINEVFK